IGLDACGQGGPGREMTELGDAHRRRWRHIICHAQEAARRRSGRVEANKWGRRASGGEGWNEVTNSMQPTIKASRATLSLKRPPKPRFAHTISPRHDHPPEKE